MDYRSAGVDLAGARAFIEAIRPAVDRTRIPGVLGGIGGFGGYFQLPAGYREPVLVAGTDGVGTKLQLAQWLNRHDTIGIDLVAMCVNDVLTSNARPLFFLDYIATGKLEAATLTTVVQGIAEGCRQSGCALLGGETAEMPGFYAREFTIWRDFASAWWNGRTSSTAPRCKWGMWPWGWPAAGAQQRLQSGAAYFGLSGGGRSPHP